MRHDIESISRQMPVKAGGTTAPTRILVVEDEGDISGLIKHTLEKSGGLEVDIAESGDAALKAISERVPDLLVLDLNLPVLSGLEVCRILRARPGTAHLPNLERPDEFNGLLAEFLARL